MIDNKGLTDKEVQDLIDWKIQCKEIDEYMWKLHAKEMIRQIIQEQLLKKD